MADYSPTGYWAHFTTHFIEHDARVTDVFPVVGYTDVALIIDEDGTVKTVDAMLEELREGGDTEGWTVTRAVTTGAGE